jgi:hypothetical protein
MLVGLVSTGGGPMCAGIVAGAASVSMAGDVACAMIAVEAASALMGNSAACAKPVVEAVSVSTASAAAVATYAPQGCTFRSSARRPLTTSFLMAASLNRLLWWQWLRMQPTMVSVKAVSPILPPRPGRRSWLCPRASEASPRLIWHLSSRGPWRRGRSLRDLYCLFTTGCKLLQVQSSKASHSAVRTTNQSHQHGRSHPAILLEHVLLIMLPFRSNATASCPATRAQTLASQPTSMMHEGCMCLLPYT